MPTAPCLRVETAAVVVLSPVASCVGGAGVTSEARVAELIFFLEDYSGVVKDQVGVPQTLDLNK